MPISLTICYEKDTFFQFNANIAITNTNKAWADIIKEDGVLCPVLIIRQGSEDVRRQ